MNFENRMWEIFYDTVSTDYKDLNYELQEFLGLQENKGIVFFLICQFTNNMRNELEESDDPLYFVVNFANFAAQVRRFLRTQEDNELTPIIRTWLIKKLNDMVLSWKDAIIEELKSGEYDSEYTSTQKLALIVKLTNDNFQIK
jgi:hypothetical protein